MKAGVFPGKSSAPELRIPAWVPPPVARVAHLHYKIANEVGWLFNPSLRKLRIDPAIFGKKLRASEEGGRPNRTPEQNLQIAELTLDEVPEETKVLISLVCDGRMRRVWHELSRRRRDGTFLHPAQSIEGVDVVVFAGDRLERERDERQGAAMAKLLEAVLHYRLPPPTPVTMTRRQAEQIRIRDLETARNLWMDALRAYFEVPGYRGDGRWRCLSDAAQVYGEMAVENYAANMQGASDRNRGDATARWVARAVSDQCRTLFGSPMYGLVAIIATVTLGRKIEARMVRQWCAHPAVRAAKNDP
jgi:hypothetical protein